MIPLFFLNSIQIFITLPIFAYNLLWIATVTLGSFFLARAFKVQLWPIFIFAIIVGILASIPITGNVFAFLLLFAGFNYAIQLSVLLGNYRQKFNFEQLLFTVFCVGGIGSLVTVLIFGYDLVGIYLAFYYAILNLLIFFRQKIEKFREFFFNQE